MRRPEQALQQAVYKYIRYAAPQALCFHVPNGMRAGGKNPLRTGAIFKTMGVMPGVADLLLFWRKGGDEFLNGFSHNQPCFAAIELKAGKGTQTTYQKDFMHQWIHLGGQYAVCRSIDEVQVSLEQWGVIKPVQHCPVRYAEGSVSKCTAKGKKAHS